MSLPRITSGVDRFLSSRPYQPCLLVIDQDVSRLSNAADLLAAHYKWPVRPLGQSLATELLDVPSGSRHSQAITLLRGSLAQESPGPLLCTDIALLFEPDLALDPLHLFLNASRKTALIVCWPGRVDANTVTYAVPQHAHYRTWSRSELCALCVLPIGLPL